MSYTNDKAAVQPEASTYEVPSPYPTPSVPGTYPAQYDHQYNAQYDPQYDPHYQQPVAQIQNDEFGQGYTTATVGGSNI